MKANFFDASGKKVKQVPLPSQFEEEIRPDLISRAVHAIQANTRQSYGALARAGKRQTARISRRRRDYKASYGKGISRSPRKTMWHRGSQFGWVGAVAPNTVSGRRAHPPKPGKIWDLKINIKERKKAIRSALAATLDAELVKQRGHQFTDLPTVVDSKIESFSKTSSVIDLFNKLGLENEVARLQIKKVRSGQGKNRGRKYRRKVGPLIVVSGDCALSKAAVNIPGVEVTSVKKLNAHLLAPGTQIGRLTIYSEKALDIMKNENLFMVNEKKPAKKEEPKKEIKKPVAKKETKK